MKFNLTKDAYEKDLISDLIKACINLKEAIIDINDLNIRQRLFFCIDRTIRRIETNNFYKMNSEIVDISDIAKDNEGEAVTINFMERLDELWSILEEVMYLVRSGTLSVAK
jgi:hypothetical protein